MYRKNTASQYIYFCLVNASTGAALTGATVTAYLALDNGSQASATGTTTELANGQYRFNLSQADTNGDYGSFLFTASSAVPVEKTVVFTQANPTDAAGFGLSRLDAAVSSRSTLDAAGVWAAGTRTLTSFGTLASDVWSVATRTLTAVGDSTGVTALLTRIVGTLASGTHNPQSGDAFARLGAPVGASIAADIATRATEAQVQSAIVDELSNRNYEAAIEALPLLSEIEASSALAKEATLNTVGELVNAVGVAVTNRPTLSQIEGSSTIAKESTLAAMKGATFDTATDSLEAIRNRGDAAWTTGAGGGSGGATLEEIENSTVLAKEASLQNIPRYGETQQWQNADDTTVEVTVTKVV